MTDTEIRERVLEGFWNAVVLPAASDDAERAEEVGRWLDFRSHVSGGSLWTSGILGLRFEVMEAVLRELIAAAPRQKHTVQRQIRRLLASKSDT